MPISVAPVQRSFIPCVLTPPPHKPKLRFPTALAANFSNNASKEEDQNNSPRKTEDQLAKLAILTLAAGVLTFGGSIQDASAAKSGGRVGGKASRSSPKLSSMPGIHTSRIDSYASPTIAPRLAARAGFCLGAPYPVVSAWGWSPQSFFAPGPRVAAEIGGGCELVAFFMVLGAVGSVISKIFRLRDDDTY